MFCPSHSVHRTATIEALRQLEEPVAVAARRGLPQDEVIPGFLRVAQSEKAGA